jgi:hypothetical protein
MNPDEARRRAQSILDGDKYQEQRLPRPFKGVLEWIADPLRPITDAVAEVMEAVLRPLLSVPFGEYILLALVIGVAAALMWWLASRRSRSAVIDGDRSALVDIGLDPDGLDRLAAKAESDGDWALVVRYRYQAGLLRLVRADRLVLRPDTTAEGAAGQVGHPVMDQLTVDFEEITYGGRPATSEDGERAKLRWAELIGTRTPR